MPELPEVETIRRQLAPRVVGRTITAADAHPSPKFAAATDAISHRIEAVARRGKYLIARLDRDRELVVHLGMTGSLRIADPHAPADPYVRGAWTLDDGSVLELRDVRRFGRIAVVPAGVYDSMPTLHALGPEPLSDDFDPAAFHHALRSSRRPVKTLLMSQRPVAGVGNIYADEALWRAGVHPASRRTSRRQSDRIHAELRTVLSDAIERGGTTLRDYRTFEGDTGRNQEYLECYGRAGRPCLRCGAVLRRSVIDQRGTTWCPQCQRRR
ncbi:MAG TPA: bifunctional DNA-formamidopyrimidine glycosylase/DNA-(apurinic or apyrimidinic site) lyase [Acidimicrobiia bacterium]